MRTIQLERNTKETKIRLKLNLDGSGISDIHTGIGFFDHMLTAFTLHGGCDMILSVEGDLEVDCHHTIEDTGILLGKALGQLLQEKSSIQRYGSFYIPMDEALAFCSLDISGRPYLVFNADFQNPSVGGFDCCMAEEFFRALAFQAGITLHLQVLYGQNDHHKLEALFKAAAHALQIAVQPRTGGVLSTKGILE